LIIARDVPLSQPDPGLDTPTPISLNTHSCLPADLLPTQTAPEANTTHLSLSPPCRCPSPAVCARTRRRPKQRTCRRELCQVPQLPSRQFSMQKPGTRPIMAQTRPRHAPRVFRPSFYLGPDSLINIRKVILPPKKVPACCFGTGKKSSLQSSRPFMLQEKSQRQT
jgi:hypothetical protein